MDTRGVTSFISSEDTHEEPRLRILASLRPFRQGTLDLGCYFMQSRIPDIIQFIPVLVQQLVITQEGAILLLQDHSLFLVDHRVVGWIGAYPFQVEYGNRIGHIFISRPEPAD